MNMLLAYMAIWCGTKPVSMMFTSICLTKLMKTNFPERHLTWIHRILRFSYILGVVNLETCQDYGQKLNKFLLHLIFILLFLFIVHLRLLICEGTLGIVC